MVKRTVSTRDHSIERPAVSVRKAMAAMNFESSSRPARVRTIYDLLFTGLTLPKAYFPGPGC